MLYVLARLFLTSDKFMNEYVIQSTITRYAGLVVTDSHSQSPVTQYHLNGYAVPPSFDSWEWSMKAKIEKYRISSFC